MADNPTGLTVKIVDGTTPTQIAAVDSSGRLSTNIGSYGGTATTLGSKVSASSIPVVIASDQGAVSVSLAANQTINAVQWNGVTVTAAATLADATALQTAPTLGAVVKGYNGTNSDLLRTTGATDGNAALTTTGILDVGVGPGFARRFNPTNLATAANSASTVDINGAGTLGVEISTTTTGTFTFEVTVDGTTWVAAMAYDVAALAFVSGTNITPTQGKVYVVSVNGMRQARLRTVSTLGATVAHVLTLSLGDVVSVSPSGGTAGSVNLTQVGGSAIAIGQAAMAASLPVVIANNQSNIPTNTVQYGGTNVVTGGVAGTVGVGGLAASGASKAGNPNQIGGVFNTTQPTVTTGQAVEAQSTARGALIVATGVDTFAVSIAANSSVNLAQVGGTNTLTGGTAGSLGIGGLAASGATASGNPVPAGLTFNTTQPTVTNGQAVQAQGTARGAVIIATGVETPAFNLTQVLGSAHSATNPVLTRMTDGTAVYAKTGQTAGTAAFAQLSDQTTAVGVIAGTTALKTDASSIAGSVPSATNPLPVRLTDGAAFYSALAGAPTLPKFSAKTSSALGAGSSVDLTHYVTSGKTGQLAGVDVTSTVPLRIAVNTELTGAKTVRAVLFSQPYQVVQYRTPFKTYITQASADATSGFSVTIKNMDSAVAADVYSTGYWDEV